MGVSERLVLDDDGCSRIAPHIIGDECSRGISGRDNRMFVEAVLWIVRTGAPWCDLPVMFSDWNSVFRRFSRLSRKGIWDRIVAAMSDDPNFEYLIVDSTIVRAHQHAAGAKKGGSEDQAVGRSLSGLTTQIHLAVRGIGCPVPMIITAGQRGDCPQACGLIDRLEAEGVMADAPHVSNRLREVIGDVGAVAVITNNRSRAHKIPLD